VPRSRIESFRDEHTDPPHWTLNSCFGAAVWLAYKTRCETSRTSAKVCNTKSCQNVSQRTDPIHPIRP